MHPPAPRRPKLLAQVCRALRLRHYSRRTEQAYVGWILRCVRFHGTRHPAELGEAEEVLGRVLGAVPDAVRARQPLRLPVVLTHREVGAILGHLSGEVGMDHAAEKPP